MNDNLNPYYTIIGETNIVVVVFGNELTDLNGYEIDAGDPFWYILGTDAWFEKQEVNSEIFLVARTHNKNYFNIKVDNETLKLLEADSGILVLYPNFLLEKEDIKQTSNLKELREWIDTEIGEENIGGLIYCFYTEEGKKKYHK